MTIYKTAYDTFACHTFVMSRVKHALDAVYHTGQLQNIPRSSAYQLQGGFPLANEVPAFAHPIQLDKGHDHDEVAPVAMDARAFGKYDSHVGGFVVRNKTEYDFLVLRTRLTNCWVREAPSLLLNVGTLAMKMYAQWIEQNVSKKFLLDPREQLVFRIYAAFFYWSLFQEHDHPLSAVDKHRAMATILKSTGAVAKEVTEVVEHFEKPINGIEEFCELASEVVSSIRLKALNVGVLYAILGNTWFNSNGKEIVAVALEHPPTWIAMITMASQDRSYKNSAVNHLLEKVDRRDKGVSFMRAVTVALDAAQA